MEQGDALLPLLFNFGLKYAIRKIQGTNLGLDMNGTHQVLAFVDDVNLKDDIRTMERSVNVLLNACKYVGLAVNTRKTKYMEVGRHRGLMINDHITVVSNLF